jgi:hypothetical protein
MWIKVMSIVKTFTEAKLTKCFVDPRSRTFNSNGCEQIRDRLCERYISKCSSHIFVSPAIRAHGFNFVQALFTTVPPYTFCSEGRTT